MADRYNRMLAVVPTADGRIEVRLDGVDGEPLCPAKELIDFVRRGALEIERARAVPALGY